ncbi:MAG: ABC transporter ATP-binding protein, partial [Pseudomonadota bacterium]|nr:ABC transporter ATP-binding protein [Pseudomonadota bacterium]
GSGKSTLLALLAGLDVPSSGRVLVNGIDITALSERERTRFRRDHVGFFFQNYHQIPSLTALENVMLPLELIGNPNASQTARRLLEEVGLADRLRHRPAQLSGGEQQRVALARAFVAEPPILFADEPTGSLDDTTGAQVLDVMLRLNANTRTTLVLVTHDPKVANHAHRRLTMQAGVVSETRSTA